MQPAAFYLIQVKFKPQFEYQSLKEQKKVTYHKAAI